MEKRSFGKTGMEVSVLGFGGQQIGQEKDLLKVKQLLNQALDEGLNVIDTAECYSDSEELIGRVLSHRRDDYYLFTKCGHATGFNEEDWDPAMLVKSIDRSLQRLKTDYVDVIHLHSCSEKILRQGAVIEVLQKAKEEGKTRFIGYSGDRTDALYAVQTGIFDSLMISLNIADQEAIELALPEAVERGMGIIAKRPVANVAWTYETLSEKAYPYVYWQRLKELQYDFLADPERAVVTALRFALTVPGVDTAIVGTQKPGRWSENAKVLQTSTLSEQEYEQIRTRWEQVADDDWVGKT
ncbi:aldo/keto reductase [Paenibacillus sp.]|jgi:aryl-alcohol dehydrogenase-like predicted oxidoreductase|uniref:aldo/keto reductase n=1 Tax=Paenibacillus sp. TaxID=58172 RepID=UPI0028241C43|nr:aldo/keto reductase [Paenibacillus sp.]MDR0267580.1 aldo/keto reductase [Paenibacillus sp.]